MKNNNVKHGCFCNHNIYKTEKVVNGELCGGCGLFINNEFKVIKSRNLQSKQNFDFNSIEKIYEEQKNISRITNSQYINIRPWLINYLFQKGNQLNLTKKSIFLACYILDSYFEKKYQKAIIDKETVACCCLILGAKSIELDDNIPFISKLKGLCKIKVPVNQLKFYEVDIALTLNWNLQQQTLYDYVMYYLTQGVLSLNDMISSNFAEFWLYELNPWKLDHQISFVEKLGKISLCDVSELYYDKINYGFYTEPKLLLKNFLKVNDFKNSRSEMFSSLDDYIIQDIVVFVEDQIEFVTEVLERGFNVWSFDKKKLAMSIIIFVRSIIFPESTIVNSMLEKIFDTKLAELKLCCKSISEYFLN